jgi:hypothetical protein
MALETGTSYMNLSVHDNSFAYLLIQVPRRSSEIPGTSGGPGHQQTLEVLQSYKRLQAEASAENGDALLSEISTSSTIASPSTQPISSVHEQEHDSTETMNLNGSEDSSDPSQPVPIKKYESLEDESFYEEVHIKPLNT